MGARSKEKCSVFVFVQSCPLFTHLCSKSTAQSLAKHTHCDSHFFFDATYCIHCLHYWHSMQTGLNIDFLGKLISC